MRNIAYIILHSRLILTTLYLILVFISCLSVDVRNYIVQCSSDGNQVGNFRSAANRVDCSNKWQSRSTIVQAIRHLVTLTFEKDSEFSAASFYGGIITAFGNADDRFHLFLIRASGMLSINCSIIFRLSCISSIRTR